MGSWQLSETVCLSCAETGGLGTQDGGSLASATENQNSSWEMGPLHPRHKDQGQGLSVLSADSSFFLENELMGYLFQAGFVWPGAMKHLWTPLPHGPTCLRTACVPLLSCWFAYFPHQM